MARPSEPIPVDLCRQLFRYDASTGDIFRTQTMGGQLAGTKCGDHQDDYIYVIYQRKRILAHRLAWAIHYGEWPKKPIDHINCNRHDNRVENLRLASVAENNRNRPKQSNNTSGFKGVTYHRSTGKFHAKIMANKKRYSLGYYSTAEEASLAYSAAASSLHKDYARTEDPTKPGADDVRS